MVPNKEPGIQEVIRKWFWSGTFSNNPVLLLKQKTDAAKSVIQERFNKVFTKYRQGGGKS